MFLFISEYLFCIDPHYRTKYSKYVSSEMLNFKFNELFMPSIKKSYSQADSVINTTVFNSVFLSDFKPEINLSIVLSGNAGNFSFFIEPIITTKNYSKSNLGAVYSRNNISGRYENAFIVYKNNNISFIFGRASLWWGQSNQNSIIQNGFYPSFDKILFRHKGKKYFFELLVGQLNSNYDQENFRIKRNISGHRLVWKPNEKLLFSIGEQIIYTGRNRDIELNYLNPFVPYLSTSFEGNDEIYPYDNDNSMIFSDFRYLIRKNFSIYAELIIDDYQIDNTPVDNATGFKIGVDGNFSEKLIYIFEFTKINPWTYIHHGQFTSWEQNYHPLGFKYGPDSRCFHLKTVFEIKNFDILFDFNFLEKGINNIYSEWNNSINEHNNSAKNYTIYNVAISKAFKSFRVELGWKSRSLNLDPTINYFSDKFIENGSYYLKMLYGFNKKSHYLH